MKICFVGLDNYPVLNPASGRLYFGGEAVQQTLLAKAFRDLGFSVSIIDRDFGQPDGEVIDGIRVWKTMREGDGLPGLRFLHPRLTSVYRALKNADADLYYQSCAGVMTGATAWFCKTFGRRFVFRIAHDNDCIPGKHILGKVYCRDSMIYHYGLRRADMIAAQSSTQQDLLRRHFGLESEIVNMAVELPEDPELSERDIDVLWVNNIRPFKRPELVLEVAKLLPEFRFVMIGGPAPGAEPLFNRIEDLAAKLDNLKFLGQVPYHQVNAYFSRSKVFFNTSETEGFPNSFLQAWIRGVPVISFFDPDSTISANGLGEVPRTVDDMACSIRRILTEVVNPDSVSHRVRNYASSHFSALSVATRYLELLESQPIRREHVRA
jgi:glycosyltransferase involved in cell wall biosynthesis